MQQLESDNYRIILKNPKVRSYRFIALLLVILNLAVFILLLIADVYFFQSAAALFLTSAYCLYRFYIYKKSKTGFFMDEVAFIILTGSWVGLQNYFFALVCVVMGILYHLALQKLLFLFNADCIKKMNFPKAEYPWNIFSNVILKDNILTLDFNNNKLIQGEIVQSTPHAKSINEIEFNQFANEQLKQHLILEKTVL